LFATQEFRGRLLHSTSGVATSGVAPAACFPSRPMDSSCSCRATPPLTSTTPRLPSQAGQ
jgi:hypothetical protein